MSTSLIALSLSTFPPCFSAAFPGVIRDRYRRAMDLPSSLSLIRQLGLPTTYSTSGAEGQPEKWAEDAEEPRRRS
ncbi:hypothetical protein C8F01DRAFT_1169311 [Mycena amicta]|nr:hypothetical protein C8F01DRAFT_1169311 [Mycena amicta]